MDADLVRRLVAAQFPQWADLPVEPVVPGGHDNRTFRLGDELSVRLPSAEGARGPGEGFPHEWSVYRWLDGEPVSEAALRDPVAFAVDLAAFLRALATAPTEDGPAPGPHSFHRGAPVGLYERETVEALDALRDRVPRDAALRVWERAVD